MGYCTLSTRGQAGGGQGTIKRSPHEVCSFSCAIVFKTWSLFTLADKDERNPLAPSYKKLRVKMLPAPRFEKAGCCRTARILPRTLRCRRIFGNPSSCLGSCGTGPLQGRLQFRMYLGLFSHEFWSCQQVSATIMLNNAARDKRPLVSCPT